MSTGKYGGQPYLTRIRITRIIDKAQALCPEFIIRCKREKV
jgi:hypothetical protein